MFIFMAVKTMAFEGFFLSFFPEFFFFFQFFFSFFMIVFGEKSLVYQNSLILFSNVISLFLGAVIAFLAGTVVEFKFSQEFYYSDSVWFLQNFFMIKVGFFFVGMSILVSNYRSLLSSNACLKFCFYLNSMIFFILFLLQSFKFLEMILIMEFMSFSLYFLMSAESAEKFEVLESGIKYFCLGGLSSGFLFLYFLCIFFCSGANADLLSVRELVLSSDLDFSHFHEYSLMLLSMAIFFKLSIFPSHLWTPEVYDGSTGGILLVFTLMMKLGFLYLFGIVIFTVYFSVYRFLDFFFYVCICLSMVFGAVGACLQTSLFSLLGYSSMNFMGFCLSLTICDLSSGFVYLYMFFSVYIFSFFGFIVCLQKLSLDSEKLKVFSQFSKVPMSAGVFLSIFFLSLAGVPPFPGFFGKMGILFWLGCSQHFFLFLVGSFCNILGYFYGLRILKILISSDSFPLKKVSRLV